MSQTHLRIFSVSRYFDLDYGTAHVITCLPWQHSGVICQCLLLLLTPTGAHWHWVTSRGRSRRWGGLRLRPRVSQSGERREMWETDQDPSAPLFVTWQLPQRRSHISHLNLYNSVKIKQYSVSGKSLMLHAFSQMETYGLSESWILKGITWLPFIFHLFASLS